MPSLTLGGILQRVRIDLDDRKERRFRAADLLGWVWEAHRDVWREVVRTGEGHGAEEGDVTYPADTRHTQLDGILAVGGRDIAHVLSVADVTGVSTGDPGSLLEQSSYTDQFGGPSALESVIRRNRAADATRWFQFGTPLRLGVSPIPSEARTLRLLWRPTLTMMVDPDDTPGGIPWDAQEGIVAKTVVLALSAAHEDASAAQARADRISIGARPFVDNRQRQGSRRVRVPDRSSIQRRGR